VEDFLVPLLRGGGRNEASQFKLLRRRTVPTTQDGGKKHLNPEKIVPYGGGTATVAGRE